METVSKALIKSFNSLAGLNWGPPQPKLRFNVGDNKQQQQKTTSFNDFNSNLSLD